MELLLKWSPALEDDTCDQHRATAEKMGSTWWGCWSSDDTRQIGRDRLSLLSSQLAEGIDVRAFVYKLGTEAEVWAARVLDLAEDETLTDLSHRPANMSFEGCFLFVELTEFVALEPGWPSEHLALWDMPEEGPLDRGALHNQTSPMYVFERP